MACATPGEELHAQYRLALRAFTAELPRGWNTRLRHDGAISWRMYERHDALPNQGWKLHISATASNALQLVQIVLPELVSTATTFKLPADVGSIIRINAGIAGPSQVGKIVTAYPRTPDGLADLIERLDKRWRPARAPAVPSDLPVGAGGALFIRYGTFANSEVVTNSLGIPSIALQAPNRKLCADARSLTGKQPEWVVPPVSTAGPTTDAQLAPPISIDGFIYLPLKVLAADLRGRVILGLRVANRQLVVIRHRVRGIEGDEFGEDAVTRLEDEKRALLRVKGLGIAPELVAHDPIAGYLVVTDAGGVQPERLAVRDRLSVLPDVAGKVAQLHAHNVVHRDLKLSNVRLGPDGLRLVDLELAASIGLDRPIPGGTDGYVPPEGRRAIVDPSYDVYSLGSCVTHAAVGCCPGRLPQQSNAGRQIGLLLQHKLPTAASIVMACHASEPRQRPTASELAERLRTALPAMQTEAAENSDMLRGVLDRRWACSAAVSAGTATRHFMVKRGSVHHWRNSHLLAAYKCEGLNLGAAGIVIGLATLDAALGIRQFTDDIVGAAEWLAARPVLSEAHGLFTGNSGVSVALAVAGQRLGRTDLVDAARWRFEHAASSRIPDYDLFSGAAGIVWAGCLLDAILGTSWGRELAKQQVRRIRASARMVDALAGWPPNPEFDSAGRTYVGAAHGTAGISMALAVWGRSTGCKATAGMAEDALHSVYAHGLTQDKSNILATTSGDTRSALQWCHGVAGYLWCLLQASANPEAAIVGARELAAAAFNRATPVLDNPTMCHGLAGVIETWRLLGGVHEHYAEARRRVDQLAGYLRLLHHTQAGATVWSSERPSVVTPDLWVGFLGPATQLALASTGSVESILSPNWLRQCAAP
ncbi:hypothetical protein RKD47_006722 [Streptomyces albogriseolus]